jgi:hypothetical protein
MFLFNEHPKDEFELSTKEFFNECKLISKLLISLFVFMIYELSTEDVLDDDIVGIFVLFVSDTIIGIAVVVVFIILNEVEGHISIN